MLPIANTMMNQFTMSGAVLVLLGGFIACAREVPAKIWNQVVRYWSINITIKDEDDSFILVKEWILLQPFSKKTRHVDLDSSVHSNSISLLPAPGLHFFWSNKRPFWVRFSRSEENKGDKWQSKRAESYCFSTVGRDRRIRKEFTESLLNIARLKEQESISVYTWNDYWFKVPSSCVKNPDSLILQEGAKEVLFGDVERFLNSKSRYDQLGIPYHRGYLFYGPPGSGKTSTVAAMSARFGMSIYLVKLSEFTDTTLSNALSRIPKKSIVLFEDIDASKSSKKRETESVEKEKQNSGSAFGVSLSGLLNSLDGLSAPSDVIFVMTTNNKNSLDPALLRPGRIDYQLFLGDADDFQKRNFYLRFFPGNLEGAEEFMKTSISESVSEVQEELVRMSE